MKRIVLLIASVAGLAAAAVAQPAYMNYQGRLLDSGGQPLTNGTYVLEFNIYDSPNGTNLVWGSFRCDDGSGDGHAPQAVIANGRFNVILGPSDIAARPLTEAFAGDDRFVEITVNGGDPILPRQQFLSAPYALRAALADNADNAAHAAYADDLGQPPPADYFLPPGMVAPFAGITNNIPLGWLLCAGQEFPTNLYPRLYTAIGTSWGSSVADHFRLPDLRGLFLRGVNEDRADGYADPDRLSRTSLSSGGNAGNAVGSYQMDALKAHKHSVPKDQYGSVENQSLVQTSGADEDWADLPGTGTTGTSTEGRPKNAYVNFIIKY